MKGGGGVGEGMGGGAGTFVCVLCVVLCLGEFVVRHVCFLFSE